MTWKPCRQCKATCSHSCRFNHQCHRHQLPLYQQPSIASCVAGPALAAGESSVWDFTAQQYGQDVALSKYKGQVLVVVNIASE